MLAVSIVCGRKRNKRKQGKSKLLPSTPANSLEVHALYFVFVGSFLIMNKIINTIAF